MNKTRLGWIRGLLIFCQLVLTVFVVQWLSNQYQSQKSTVRQQIISQYFESKDQVLDSILVKEVVNPVIQTGFIISADSTQRDQATIVAFGIEDTLTPDLHSNDRHEAMKRAKDEMLLRSIKLYITHAENQGDSLQGIAALSFIDQDTSLFRHVFTDRMSRSGLSVAFNWVSDSSRFPHREGNNVILLSDSMSGRFPSATIGKINSLVVKRMSTEILFGIILLVLTGSAFIITFRSLKKQLMLNNLRNDFVSNISHELKTPVATVKVALEALRSPRIADHPEKVSEYLSMAYDESSRLEKLVGRVMDQSLLEESGSLLQKEPIDLNNLVAEVVKGFEVRIEATEARFIIEAQESDLIIPGDPLYLTSVLVNLIENSLKYSVPPVEIRINTYRSDGMACLSVEDNGPGIPKEYQSKIFDKFFRIPDKRQIKGYGLGLTFARQVVLRHQGTITVSSLDPGCRFTISLPLAT